MAMYNNKYNGKEIGKSECKEQNKTGRLKRNENYGNLTKIQLNEEFN
jgi:hypothetical protein